MARDYKPRRKAAATFSGWIGLASGLALGLAVAAGVYIRDHRPDLPSISKLDRKRPAHSTEPPPDAQEGGAGAADDAGRSYDFYSSLPKFEVVVPERDKDVHPDIRAVPETRRGTYVLQAGSYKSFADADRVRARLALQGVESKVQKVSVDNDTWHRIRIGPISNLDQLNKLRATLRKADVDVLVIRVGD